MGGSVTSKREGSSRNGALPSYFLFVSQWCNMYIMLNCVCRRRKRRTESGERRTDDAERAQRELAHYAEPRGRKACEAGLTENGERKTENGELTMRSEINGKRKAESGKRKTDFAFLPLTPLTPLTPLKTISPFQG